MLEQLKVELAGVLESISGDEALQKLYSDEVHLLFEALSAARDTGDIAVQVNIKKVQQLFKEHRYQEALGALENLLLNQNLLSERDVLEALEQKGVALTMIGKYEEAERIFKDLMNSELVWAKRKAMVNLGITYCYIAKHTGKKLWNDAMQLFNKAQELLEPEDREDKFRILHHLAHIYFEKGNFVECEKFQEAALQLADTDQHKAMVFNELARVNIALNHLDAAMEYLDHAERILIKRSNFHELALAWNIHIRGLLYKRKGEYTNAINCLELALTTFVEKELYSEAAEVSYELYALNKFVESGDADEYLSDYQYYSRMIS